MTAMTKMCTNHKSVPFEEAVRAVSSASRRIALLHLSYSETVIEELGKKKGMELISRAIKLYGSRIGQKTREEVIAEGFDPTPENFGKGKSYAIPKFGMHDKIESIESENQEKRRAYGCLLASVWREYEKEDLGRLYCYMDVAKFMAYNPDYKLVHIKTIPNGDKLCEFAVKTTTEDERKDFLSEKKDWFYIDK